MDAGGAPYTAPPDTEDSGKGSLNEGNIDVTEPSFSEVLRSILPRGQVAEIAQTQQQMYFHPFSPITLCFVLISPISFVFFLPFVCF